MKIFYLSGICPSFKNRIGGIFITKQIEYIKKYLDGFELVGLVLGFKKTKLGFHRFNVSEIQTGKVVWKIITITFYLFSILIDRLVPLKKWVMKSILGKFNIQNYDLIHAHWINTAGVCAMYLSKILHKPYIITAHGSDIHTKPYKSSSLMKRTLSVLEKADRAVFVSHELLESAKQLGYSGQNAAVIYNGVDKQVFFKHSLSKAEEMTGIKKNAFIIGFVGYLEHIKAADLLPEAFSRINKNTDAVKFIIIGSGSLRHSVLQRLDELELDYEFTGRVDNNVLPYYYSLMDILFIPSRKEGFGVVALEAMACDVQVIARKTGGLIEILQKQGTLIEDNEDFIETATSEILMKKQEIEQGLIHNEIEKHFTIENTGEQYLKLYKTLINN